MNELAKTGLFVGVAIVLVGLAIISAPGSAEPVFFDDAGEEFSPAFVDPREAASLEVWEFDAEVGEAIAFKVEQKDDRWTIPSHYDYPADAVERMAKAASLVIGLRKQKVITDDRKDHAALGVLDPTDPGLELEGRGTRVTFESSGGGTLADLIIGKEADGDIDLYYVREPGGKRVYAAKLSTEISTKFEDWIERDLLKASSWDLQQIVFDNYSVNEQTGRLVRGDTLTVGKDDSNQWVLQGLAETEETNRDRVTEVVNTLTDLKIVGVRPKPPGLTAALEQASGFDRLALESLLNSKGYFLGRDGKLYSNEGDLIAQTRKGVVYTLKFGEIVYGTGDAVTSGQAADAGAQKQEAGEQGPQPAAGNHRFLMITAEFDEALVDKPDAPRLTQEELDQRKAARDQIEKIVAAIDDYRKAHEDALPETLAVLTEGDEPPLDELPKDPWENDYVLEPKEEGYAVVSFGADGAAGGEGTAHDVRSDDLAAEDALRTALQDWKSYDQKVEDGRKEATELAERFGPWYYVIDAESFGKLKVQRENVVKEKPKTEEGQEAGKEGAGGNDR